MEVNTLLGKLKPFENKTVLVSNYQDSADIIKEIVKAHNKYANEYDKIAPYFWKGSLKKTCKYIFDYLKKHVDYDIEPDTKQTVKSPAAIIAQGYGDCKHYSLFTAGILDSLRRSGKPIKWAYRFANYKLFSRTPHHVFCVADPKTKHEIWIDPVLEFFDNKKAYVNATDKNYTQMALYSISGVDEQIGFRRRQRRAFLLRALQKRLNFLARRGWNNPQNPYFKRYEFLQNRINRLKQISGFDPNLNLQSVAGIGCCNAVGYTAAQRKKEMNYLWHKMQNYRRAGWNNPNSPYYNEYFLARKEYMRVRSLPTVNGVDDFSATTSIEGIGRRSRAERRARRRARRERRRSGPNCKGRTFAKITLSPARRAFLLLVRINFKKLGVRIYKGLQDPNIAPKIYAKWCGLGGNAALLRRTAEKAYQKAKRRGKVSGVEGIGVAVTTVVAAASAVLAAIEPILKLIKGGGADEQTTEQTTD